MSENKMVVSEKDTRIAPWGNRNEIREIARRVQLMAPGGRKLNENEALALAQGAVAHGLDPFNGEIWYIPGSGLMAGVKGLRKAARNQIEGNFWPEFEQIMDPDERHALLIPDGALAFRCILRDTETISAYSRSWKDMVANGVPVEVIPTIIGKRPYTEGIGYLKPGEKTRMDPAQCAMKRAEADALKRRFDLPFAIPSEPNGEVVEAEWTESTIEEETETEEGIKEKAKVGVETLFGEDDDGLKKVKEERPAGSRPWNPVDIRNRINQFVDEYKGERKDQSRPGGTLVTFMAWQMNELFPGDPKPDGKRIAVLNYLFERKIESTKDLTGAELRAVERWLEPKEWEGLGAGITPRKEAKLEAASIFTTYMKEKGQQELING